jgi:hypothetical protein
MGNVALLLQLNSATPHVVGIEGGKKIRMQKGKKDRGETRCSRR